MANENQNSKFSGIASKIKWFFHKSKNKSWESLGYRKTLSINRKDTIVSVLTSIAVLAWAIFYWIKVLDKYEAINSGSDALKNLSSYNVTADETVLFPYIWNNDIWTIIWMTSIYNDIDAELDNNKKFQQQQQSYYEIFLQNIYLPSLNVRKNPYTKTFDVTLLWQKYLETDKFQDLFLIQYRSDFIKYVWNDADYNKVENITIWDKVEVPWNSDYFYAPISISFSSPNKRSFLLLVNKLSLTSTQSNISLINEFFFYLIQNIKEKKWTAIEKLEREYRGVFSSNYDWKTFSEVKNGTLSGEYRDKVLGYSLNRWLNGEDASTELIDNEVMIKTIREATLCNNSDSNQTCFYNFRSKYRNIPYLAYQVWLDNQTDRVSWLRSFLNSLPPIIAITDFSFDKKEISFLDSSDEWLYEWRVSFNAYWRNITQEELDEAWLLLWKLCFWKNENQILSVELALSRVNDTLSEKWWNRDYSDITSLDELKWLLENIQNTYWWMPTYNKMIKLFEIRRMMNDANLCAN